MYMFLGKMFSVTALVVTSAALSIGGAWAAGLQYSNSLESGFGDVHFHGGCYSYSFALVDSPVRDGTKSVRVLNKGMEDNSNCTDWAQGSKHRAEIRWGAKATYADLRSPYWFGFSVFVPENYPTSGQSTDATLVSQWIGGAYGPELSFQIRAGNTWEIRRDWSTGSGDKGNEMTQAKISVERGVWTDWVVYRERSWDMDGVLKIWKNGKLVVDFVGPTAINYAAHGQLGNIYVKMGTYWGTEPRPVDYTLYFDSIRAANVADGYALVAPNAGSVLVATPPPAPTGLSMQLTP